MICPFCANEKTIVMATVKGLANERFRKCPKCGRTFSTIEVVKAKDEELIEYKKIEDESLRKRR